MERIAPLAKILAEANGIEWQQLKGTGVGGMIIEQDILDYLSRVMSGEAEPPSTPVDLPPPDWNGEDVPGAGMFDANMLSQAGVESDIADFVQQSRPAAAAPAPTLSQDDFELDDADDDDLMAPEVTPAPAAVTPSMPALQSMPSLTPSAPSIPAAPMPTIPAPAAPSIPSFTPAAPQVPATPAPQAQAPAAPAPQAQPSGGLTGLLSRLYHKDEPKAEEPKAPAVAPSFTAPSVSEDAPAPSLSSVPSFAAPTAEVHQEPVAPAAPAFSLGKTAELSTAPVAPTMPESPVLEQPAAAPEPVVPAFEERPAAPQPQFEPPAPRFEEREVEPVEVEEVAAPVEPVAEEVEQIEEVSAPIAVPATPAAAPMPQVAAPVQSGQAQTGQAQSGQAVWFGTYLRRDAQVAQLHELREQLSEALEREVPLSLLVARAAQRHAVALGLETVAMRDMERGSVRQMGGQVGSSVSLRDALVAVDEAFEGQPDLLVVDAGALDMDDLHYPETLTLSVGRVQDGRASLSLQGEVDQEKAARFLASVAQTLEKPVILLV